jgi:hypothetical protein
VVPLDDVEKVLREYCEITKNGLLDDLTAPGTR